MIWGMTLQPGYEYTEIVDDEVRLSMATLECRPRKSQGDTFELSSHVVLKTVRGEFLLCNLEKGPTPQQSLDLVLQPRERVTFSVEGTGVVYLMGYTSECPEEQLDQEEPIDNVTELPPAEHHPELPHPEEIEEMVGQQPLEEENEDITVKSEPEAVVIPILEEALEEMDQAAKEEITASSEMLEEELQGTTPIQALSNKDPPGTLPSDNYGYQQISQEEGWISPEQSRMRGVPTDSVPSTETPPSFSGGPMRSMQGGMSSDMPSTSYSHTRQMHAGQSSRAPATRRPAATGNTRRSVTKPTYPPGNPRRSVTRPTNPPVKTERSVNQPVNVQANTGRSVTQPINTPPMIAEDLGDSTQPEEWGGQDFFSASSTNDDSDSNVASVRQVRNEMTSPSTKRLDKMYRCRHCRKEFMNRSTFLVHERRHTGKTCFHCQYCMKPFASRSELRIHERYHTGEKPFECRYCLKRFETSGNWKKHERCHTGEKPYSCSFCGKGFADMSNWRKHERTHLLKQS